MKSKERQYGRAGMDERGALYSDRSVLDALAQDIDVRPEVLRPIDSGGSIIKDRLGTSCSSTSAITRRMF